MQRRIVWTLWVLASMYGLWRGVRLAFFPFGLQVTTSATPAGTSSAPEVITPTFFVAGVPILLALIVLYSVLGYTLAHHEIRAFRILAGLHALLSIVAGSIGWLFLPSSTLLLLAALLARDSWQAVRQDALRSRPRG